MTVTIGRDPAYRGGKYVIFVDGQPTRMWAARVRQIAASVPDPGERLRDYPDVTDEMVAAVQGFDWPLWDTPRLEFDETAVRCVCGETTWFSPESDRAVTCEACGRRWRVTVQIEEVAA